MNVRTAVRRPAVIAAITVGAVTLGFGGQAAADAFITGKDVKNGSLTGADIASGSIKGSDIKTNTITWSDIANGTVRSTEIKNGSILLKDLSPALLEQLGEPFALISAGLDEAFADIESLQNADTATAAEIASIKASATTLAGRVTAAEGTIDELTTGAAALNADLTALQTRVDGLEDKVEGLEALAPVFTNWGTVLRNTIQSANTTLRQGPGPLANIPSGKGSLEINVANSTSKAAYGNEVDFAGDALSSIGAPGFSVYQTGENNGVSAGNLPNIAVEVFANGATGYSTLVFVPTKAAASNSWTSYTSTDGKWYFTGGVGTSTGCNQNTMCTLTDAIAAVPNAKVISVAISKGRDSEWHGAVDNLVVGTKTYDFEARGVIARNNA